MTFTILSSLAFATGDLECAGDGAAFAACFTVDGVYNFPSLGFASVVPGQKGRFQLAVGGRVKYANVVHSHLVVDSSGNATPAAEMNGRETDTSEGTLVAVESGVLAHRAAAWQRRWW